jgi:hypothetical protein
MRASRLTLIPSLRPQYLRGEILPCPKIPSEIGHLICDNSLADLVPAGSLAIWKTGLTDLGTGPKLALPVRALVFPDLWPLTPIENLSPSAKLVPFGELRGFCK